MPIRPPQHRPAWRSFLEIVVVDPAAAPAAGPSGCAVHLRADDELIQCGRSFRHFLPHWRFVNRETGDLQSFRELWASQDRSVTKMELHRWLVILKAGKLGISELECAFDGWRHRFGGPNARVHLFSMDAQAAIGLLGMVRFGLDHLPEYMRLPLASQAGSDTLKQLIYRAGNDDLRRIISYAPTKKAAIDATALHTHVDELARMPHPEETWAAVESTVAPGGTVHVVSRGAGAQNYLTTLFHQAEDPASVLEPMFEPWWARPRFPEGELLRAKVARGEIEAAAAWYAEQEAAMPTTSQLWYYAPETAAQALAGAAEDAFIDIARWDACYSPALPSLQPGDPTPLVMSCDAGVTNDVFAITLCSRNPANFAEPALRAYKAWIPAQEGGTVDFGVIEDWIRTICLGGCANAATPHPNAVNGNAQPREGCPECEAGQRIARLNVAQIVYDPYELRDMMQRLSKEGVAWCKPLDQGSERLEADTQLKMLLLQRGLVHHIDPADANNLMRVHVQGAKGKIPAGDDDRIRIEKQHPRAKVDLLVSLSMGVYRCLHLWLENAA